MHPKSLIRPLIHLARLVVATALAACSVCGVAAEIKVAVATTPLSTPFYVAEKQGYFADEGLAVTLMDCAGGHVCLKQLLEGPGQVQLATASDLPIMFRSFERQNFYVLATFAASTQDVKLETGRDN